jgi:hypothetical protein
VGPRAGLDATLQGIERGSSSPWPAAIPTELSRHFQWKNIFENSTVACRDPFLGRDRETDNKTTSAARQQILNMQIHAAVIE